jgi:hypothetical protein
MHGLCQPMVVRYYSMLAPGDDRRRKEFRRSGNPHEPRVERGYSFTAPVRLET